MTVLRKHITYLFYAFLLFSVWESTMSILDHQAPFLVASPTQLHCALLLGISPASPSASGDKISAW
ncbi:hypothetical protein JHK82_032414 [Glycine max]|nr:hypothetical protein GLYMA_12G003800v4 [Glycine max]KAG4966702.1 hypothetical protein JHK87_032353 [Glycine soja]KAG4979166.1 hypothetical protein JHK85_033124 [Glycine max]KAG4984822.1 hypothetical protein JHK86_032513 [Glycine max]KAG5117994.1 hypothetical protein JHK82_032414 [Glycine max]